MRDMPLPPEKPIVKLHIPVEGQLWLLAAAVFLATGIFKGINLVTLLACLMAVTWTFSFLGTRRRLRDLIITRQIPRTIFAGAAFPVEFSLSHLGRRPLFSLRVEDHGPDGAWCDYVPSLPGGGNLLLRRTAIIHHAGRYVWAPVSVSSGFPFGLVESVSQYRAGNPVVVLPALGRLQKGRVRSLLGYAARSGGRSWSQPVPVPAGANEVHGVRHFRSGDSPRWIHWRTTARRGELMVREFEDTPSNDLIVVLDPWIDPKSTVGDGNSPLQQPRLQVALRDAISLVASVCWEWCRQPGDRLVLAVANETPAVWLGKTGRDYGIRLLEHLADQHGSPHTDGRLLADRLASMALTPGPILLVSTRPDSFADVLQDRFRRSVLFVNAASLSDCGFYERPASDAV